MLQRSLLLSPEQRSELIQLRRLFISKLSSIIDQRKEIYTLLTVSHRLAAELQALHCKTYTRKLCSYHPRAVISWLLQCCTDLCKCITVKFVHMGATSTQDVSPASPCKKTADSYGWCLVCRGQCHQPLGLATQPSGIYSLMSVWRS